MKMEVKKEELKRGMDAMLACGTRYTGSSGHRQFVDYIKARLEEMQVPYYTDPFYFRRWEAKKKGLSILSGEDELEIPVSSAHPYSGETEEAGVVAPLYFVENLAAGFAGVRGKIAVIEVSDLDFLPSAFAFDRRSAYPESLVLPRKYRGPVTTTFAKNFYGKLCRKFGAKAAVFIWKGISADLAEGQYLPFVLPEQGLPILWVNEQNGRQLIAAAKAGRRARLTLTAEIEAHAYTETVYCILKGENERECIVVNTHTDGPNFTEENGAVSLLHLIDQLRGQPLARSHLFLFTTGHFRLPEFEHEETGGTQASSRWMSMHRALWDGVGGHTRAVAALTLEHLGCLEWAERDGEYQPTGEIQPELVYTGNRFLDRLYLDEVRKNRSRVRTMTLRGHNKMHFGEGQNFCMMGIPDIALCTAPDYLCVESGDQELEKFDLDLMTEQTQTFANLICRLEACTADEIGRAEPFSVLVSHDPAGELDWTPAGIWRGIQARRRASSPQRK